MSAKRTFVASVLEPLPMELTRNTPDARQYWMRAILGLSVSMASTTQSGANGSRTPRMEPSSTNCPQHSKSRFGLISRSRERMTEHLLRPTVECSAGSWRFMLLSDTVSASTRSICPTPARQSISAAIAPTPPRPTTATRAEARDSRPPSPNISAVLSCQGSISASNGQAIQRMSDASKGRSAAAGSSDSRRGISPACWAHP